MKGLTQLLVSADVSVEGDSVLGRRVRVEAADLDQWCRGHLGAGVDRVLFSAGDLSTALGIELTSGAQVVVKIRPWADRLRGCATVHRRLFEVGFPCPEPVVALEPMGVLAASAEAMVTGGDPYPSSGRLAAPFAAALARLVALAPHPSEVPALRTPPPMVPDFGSAELWPVTEEKGVDLNAASGPAWIDEAGWVARSRLAASVSPLVVGHGDFWTGNLRWSGDKLLTVWDWDSAIAASEPAIAGLAAAVYAANDPGTEPTVEESEAFLDAYQATRGRFSGEELTEAWAAALWGRSFDAKEQTAAEGRPKSLTESEAIELCRRVDKR